MGECVNQTGFSCTNERCECENRKPEPMKSLSDISNYQKGVILNIITLGTIKRVELLEQLPFSITDRKMRLLIVELIQDGQPISSSEKGYSIIKNVDQLRQAVNYLKAKSKSLAIRGNTLIGNYDRQYQNAPANLQFKLF